MNFATINGVTIHHQLIGAAEGKPTLVFANSLGTDFRIWRDVVVALAGEAAIVNYDKRGHGLSDIGNAPYQMDDHVDDLIALLEYLNVSNAVISGVSVGGMIAQGVYAKRPDLVSGLILCDTGHKIGNEDFWNDRIELISKNGLEAFADTILERWFTSQFRTPDNADFAGYRNMLVRTTLDGYIGTCTALRDADFTDEAKRIAVPTLCMVGDQDGSTPPALVEELCALIPKSQYELIKDCGHIPSIEQPEAVVQHIRNFLARNGFYEDAS